MGNLFSKADPVNCSFNKMNFNQKTEIIKDFVTYSQRKNIEIEDNFNLVLRLLLSSSVWYLKYLKQINQKIKLAEDNLEKSIKNEELQAYDILDLPKELTMRTKLVLIRLQQLCNDTVTRNHNKERWMEWRGYVAPYNQCIC